MDKPVNPDLAQDLLGIDNIIFISIVAGKLPTEQQKRARNIGLLLALVFRVGLLLCINWIISLKDPVIFIPAWKALSEQSLESHCDHKVAPRIRQVAHREIRIPA